MLSAWQILKLLVVGSKVLLQRFVHSYTWQTAKMLLVSVLLGELTNLVAETRGQFSDPLYVKEDSKVRTDAPGEPPSLELSRL